MFVSCWSLRRVITLAITCIAGTAESAFALHVHWYAVYRPHCVTLQFIEGFKVGYQTFHEQAWLRFRRRDESRKTPDSATLEHMAPGQSNLETKQHCTCEHNGFC